MSTQSQIKPNKFDEVKKVFEKRKLETPETIREDEAHLMHLVEVKSVPNARTLEFEHSFKVIKLPVEAVDSVANQLERMQVSGNSVLVTLHDGKEYKAGAADRKKEADAKEAELQEQKKLDDQKLADDANAKNADLQQQLNDAKAKQADLEKELAEAKKATKVEEKANAKNADEKETKEEKGK